MKLNISRLSKRLPRVRFKRAWRGYSIGTVIQPPADMRQVMLQAKDFMGNQVAELVEDEPVVETTVPEVIDVTDDFEDEKKTSKKKAKKL